MAGAVVAVVGAVVSAVSQHNQGRAQKKAADMEATMAAKEADYEARQSQKATEKLISEQRAAYAASGVTMEGTPFEVMDITLEEGEEERQNILQLGGMRSRAFWQEGRAAERYGTGQAAGTLLGGTGSAIKGIGKN